MDLGLRQKDVAALLGINKDTVRNWEAPSARLVRMAEALLAGDRNRRGYCNPHRSTDVPLVVAVPVDS
jgi:hypothetical protein